MVDVVFIAADGTRTAAFAPAGRTLLEVAQAAGMPLEGTCEGQMACSTCHVIIAREWFAHVPRPAPDEEDMLDLAAGVAATSRLACQIVLHEMLSGLVARIPATANDMRVR